MEICITEYKSIRIPVNLFIYMVLQLISQNAHTNITLCSD